MAQGREFLGEFMKWNTVEWAIKTETDKDKALLGRFIQQSFQNNLDERKRILSDLHSTLAQSSPDVEIREDELNEAKQASYLVSWLVLWA